MGLGDDQRSAEVAFVTAVTVLIKSVIADFFSPFSPLSLTFSFVVTIMGQSEKKLKKLNLKSDKNIAFPEIFSLTTLFLPFYGRCTVNSLFRGIQCLS